MATRNAKLNFKKIIKNGKVISTKESLRDITPIPWNKDVLNGNKKVVITEGGKDICAK
jgi:hypothetical protein